MALPRELYSAELWGKLHEIDPETYPDLTTAEYQEIESKKIREKYAAMMADIVKPYLQTERETWPTQLKEANMYLADPHADVPLITALATHRGVALPDLVTWIKGNESVYRTAVGTILGMQQAELDALYAEKP